MERERERETMRQRKRAQREPSETLSKESSEEENQIGDGDDGEQKGFYACYLLISLSPRHKGHTYIGYYSPSPSNSIPIYPSFFISKFFFFVARFLIWNFLMQIHGEPTPSYQAAQRRNRVRSVANQEAASLGDGLVHPWLPF